MKKFLLIAVAAITMMAVAIGFSTIASVSSTPVDPPATALDSTPVPIFIAHPFAGNAPLRVAFKDQSVYSPTSWSWDFGDGNTSTEQNPVNIYGTPGRYTVSLTVANAAGSNTVVYPDYINVRPARAPLPTFAPTSTPFPTITPTPTPSPKPTTGPRPTPMKPMPPMQPWQ